LSREVGGRFCEKGAQEAQSSKRHRINVFLKRDFAEKPVAICLGGKGTRETPPYRNSSNSTELIPRVQIVFVNDAELVPTVQGVFKQYRLLSHST
jgi:hypothetical protein